MSELVSVCDSLSFSHLYSMMLYTILTHSTISDTLTSLTFYQVCSSSSGEIKLREVQVSSTAGLGVVVTSSLSL